MIGPSPAWLALALALPTATGPAAAGALDRSVLATLQSPAGWTELRTDSDGLVVRSKPATGRTAFQGELPLPASVDRDRLWRLLSDIDGHTKHGDQLAEAKVFLRQGKAMEYFQVMVPPPLMPGSQRYWFGHTELEDAVGGNPAHRRRCWSGLPPGEAAAARAGVKARHPRAIEGPMTHGCWELRPTAQGHSLVYTTVSDPGGSVPDVVARSLTSRTLPDNMRNFVRAAQR